MTAYLHHDFDRDDANLVSVTDELPLWSAAFGLRLLDTIVLQPHLRVLDIGCGMGFPLMEVAERLGPSCTVYGIDPWQAAVDRAEQKRKTFGLDNVVLKTAAAESMPFDGGFFDLLVSNNGINNVQDIEQSLSECRRVSKVGAQFVLTFNLPASMREFYSALESVLERRQMHATNVTVQEHINQKRPTVSMIESLLQAHGFAVTTTQHDSFTLRFLSADALFHHHLIKFWFLPAWKELIAPQAQESVFIDLERSLNEQARRRGEITLTIPFATIDARKQS